MPYRFTSWPVEANEYVERIEKATAQLTEDITAGMSTIKRRQVLLCIHDLPKWVNESCRIISESSWKIVELAPDWNHRPPHWYEVIKQVIETAEAIDDNVLIVREKARTHWFETTMAYLEEMADQADHIRKIMGRIPMNEEKYLITLPKPEQQRKAQ